MSDIAVNKNVQN